jgi:hypothetical protein
MNNKVTKKLLIIGVCLFAPISYAAEPEDFNLKSVDLFDTHKTSFKSDEVQIIQQGNYNQAIIDVTGKNNKVGLTQNGNRNAGDIQLDGDRNKILASQDGNNMGFALKVTGDNRNYTVTQTSRR